MLPLTSPVVIDRSAVSKAARNLLSIIGTSILYAISLGIPFYYHAHMSWQLGVPAYTQREDSRNIDVERAGGCLDRQIAGWKTLRIANGIMFLGVGTPAFLSYYLSWPLEEKWPVIFLLLSVVLSVISFGFSTVLIAVFVDWSVDVNELKDHILAWSILFSFPATAIAWSTASLMTAAIVLVAEKIVFDNTINYLQAAITILMIIMGIGVTSLFYMVHHFWHM